MWLTSASCMIGVQFVSAGQIYWGFDISCQVFLMQLYHLHVPAGPTACVSLFCVWFEGHSGHAHTLFKDEKNTK